MKFWPIVRACWCLIALSGCAQFGGTGVTAPAKLRPEDLVALERQAGAAYDQQDWTTSEQHFIALTKAAPASVEPWFKLGNIYARTNRYALAVRAYGEVVVRDARHSRAWHNMGVIQLRQAAQSFAELEKYALHDDPLAVRGAELEHAIDQLLAPEPDAAAH